MLNFRKIISIVLLSGWIFVSPAMAATENFQWQGKAGYAIAGVVNYDETTASEIISATSNKTTNQIQSLTVTFYSPEGKPIHTYHNVIDSVVQGHYLEFNFDTTTHQPVGQIDLGGESAGETYFKGIVDDKLSWIAVEPSGAEHIIDEFSFQKK